MTIDIRHITKREHSVEVLNRLLALLDCSLARICRLPGHGCDGAYLLLDAVARRMSYEHEIFARRIARLISDRRGMVQSCVFPMGFTSYNDLSLEFLAPRLLEHQRALVVTAEESAETVGWRSRSPSGCEQDCSFFATLCRTIAGVTLAEPRSTTAGK